MRVMAIDETKVVAAGLMAEEATSKKIYLAGVVTGLILGLLGGIPLAYHFGSFKAKG